MGDALCKLCARLEVYDAVEHVVNLEDNTTDSVCPLQSPWHNTLGDVEASSFSCALCAIIMKGWQASREMVVEQATRDAMFDPDNPRPDLKEPIHRIQAYREASATITLEVARHPLDHEIAVSNVSSLSLLVGCRPGSGSSFDVVDPVMAELRITLVFSDVEDLALKKIRRHTDPPIDADPLSDPSFSVVSSFLRNCEDQHGSACGTPAGEDGWMPTRLLDVNPGSEGQIGLREYETLESAEDRRYVALSHCWGPDGTPLTTTRETLPLRKRGIAIRELPKTFRDAVVMTQRLGVRYLWIDSLCIVQDDAEDWAREAGQMAKVYRNAYLTLNAATSDADTEGFLRPRPIPDRVRLPPTSPSLSRRKREEHGFYLQLLPPQGRRWLDPEMDCLVGEPTSSRAWCLQERVLPRRSLHFGSRQIFWECERLRASEYGDSVAVEHKKVDGSGGGGGRLARLCRTGDNAACSVFARGSGQRDPTYEEAALGYGGHTVKWADWYHGTVAEYTARCITRHTDRLPALSGLVQAVIAARQRDEEATGSEGDDASYLAGLWESGLIEGLLWCKGQPNQAPLAPTPEYVAPSWSWASVVGPVQFPVYTWYARRARWKARMADLEPLAEYIGHLLAKRDDADPYGRLIEGGYLLLKAPLLPVLSTRPRPVQAPALYSLFGQAPGRSEVADIVVQMKVGGSGKKSVWVEGGFDTPDAVDDSAKLFVAMLARLPHVLEEGLIEQRFGLLLEQLGDDSRRYRRVGFIDGVVLQKSLLGAIRGHGMFTIVGYARPFQKDDIYEVERDNDLASTPLVVNAVELEIY
ncbi:hypothetical protein VTI28DRAFT_1067 [Corynascus sepedonium]